MERVRDDKDDPFAGLDDVEEDAVQILGGTLTILKEKFGDQFDLNITADEYIDFEIEVATTQEWLSNQEILADITDDQVEISDKEDEESVEIEPVTNPGIEEARKAIQTLEKFSLFSIFGEAMM